MHVSQQNIKFSEAQVVQVMAAATTREAIDIGAKWGMSKGVARNYFSQQAKRALVLADKYDIEKPSNRRG